MGRAGYPVRICQLIQFEFDKTGTPTGNRKEYWSVDSGYLGQCGHEHTSEADAEPCRNDMEAKYRQTRWPKRKKGSQ